MNVIINQDGNKYDVSVEGRIDSVTANQFLSDLTPLLQAKDADITVDCKDMSYTSSQGLRVFLMLQKSAMANGGKLVLVNMAPAVKEVFDITGFSSIIKIV